MTREGPKRSTRTSRLPTPFCIDTTQAIGREQMLDAVGHRCGVVRLHRQQNQIEWTFEARRIACEDEIARVTIAEDAADAQAIARDRIEVSLAAEQRDLVAGADAASHP